MSSSSSSSFDRDLQGVQTLTNRIDDLHLSKADFKGQKRILMDLKRSFKYIPLTPEKEQYKKEYNEVLKGVESHLANCIELISKELSSCEVAIVGETGVGKTTLLNELVQDRLFYTAADKTKKKYEIRSTTPFKTKIIRGSSNKFVINVDYYSREKWIGERIKLADEHLKLGEIETPSKEDKKSFDSVKESLVDLYPEEALNPRKKDSALKPDFLRQISDPEWGDPYLVFIDSFSQSSRFPFEKPQEFRAKFKQLIEDLSSKVIISLNAEVPLSFSSIPSEFPIYDIPGFGDSNKKRDALAREDFKLAQRGVLVISETKVHSFKGKLQELFGPHDAHADDENTYLKKSMIVITQSSKSWEDDDKTQFVNGELELSDLIDVEGKTEKLRFDHGLSEDIEIVFFDTFCKNNARGEKMYKEPLGKIIRFINQLPFKVSTSLCTLQAILKSAIPTFFTKVSQIFDENAYDAEVAQLRSFLTQFFERYRNNIRSSLVPANFDLGTKYRNMFATYTPGMATHTFISNNGHYFWTASGRPPRNGGSSFPDSLTIDIIRFVRSHASNYVREVAAILPRFGVNPQKVGLGIISEQDWKDLLFPVIKQITDQCINHRVRDIAATLNTNTYLILNTALNVVLQTLQQNFPHIQKLVISEFFSSKRLEHQSKQKINLFSFDDHDYHLHHLRSVTRSLIHLARNSLPIESCVSVFESDQKTVVIQPTIAGENNPSAFASALENHKLQALQSIVMRFCCVTTKSLEQLVPCLQSLNWKHLDLSGNFLDSSSIPALQALAINGRTVNITMNDILGEFPGLTNKILDFKSRVGPKEFKKVAVVIGNSDYHTPLPNVVGDRIVMKTILESTGFKICPFNSFSSSEEWSNIISWVETEVREDLVSFVFYFSGHGGSTGIPQFQATNGELVGLVDVFNLLRFSRGPKVFLLDTCATQVPVDRSFSVIPSDCAILQVAKLGTFAYSDGEADDLPTKFTTKLSSIWRAGETYRSVVEKVSKETASIGKEPQQTFVDSFDEFINYTI
eukprot:TRINITY_DN16_c0_g1_i1.p1 TRINITY_DN16_c0_g1~~TRINITY_DN16_c0_g1_i1.p1  ORF type:complete len:1025 (+),score=-21.50 TRINITY_DN16_c0_g1_i1:43-3117(+)